VAWEGSYTPGDPYAVVTVTGELTKTDIAELRQYTVDLVRGEGLQGSLLDVTACVNAPSPSQLMVAAIQSPLPPMFRRAYLVGKNLQAEANAVETAFVNRHAKARVFSDRDEAIAWLTEG
jgi:hypothetical protein